MSKAFSKSEESTVKATLEEGKKSKFWQYITRALEESKAFIQAQQDSEDLKELSPEIYKLQNELFKAKKVFLDHLIKTPDNIISWLQQPSNERQEFDPYDKSS